ncbi:MAG: dethiobiotin synthase [Acidobacteriota bacterium]
MRGIFVTGTDTNVGKTIVAAALMHRYRATVGLRYWKPIQTGLEIDDDTAMVYKLGECREGEIFSQGIRLSQPLSPHLAARLSSTEIEIDRLTVPAWQDNREVRWIVEGAGGVLVPLNNCEFIIDLIVKLSLPVLVVARSSLGTINHTLLTLAALRSRSLQIAGVVMVGAANQDNREAIEHFGKTSVLGELDNLTPLTSSTLGVWAQERLDPNGLLEEFLR